MRGKLKLWWLRRELTATQKSYAKGIDKAKGDEREYQISEWLQERSQRRSEISILRTTLLCEEAENLGIAVPPLSDKDSWEDGLLPGTTHLTLKAQAQLLQAIRKEKEERWRFFVFILKEVVTPLVGAIGAIMGLLSLLHSFKSK